MVISIQLSIWLFLLEDLWDTDRINCKENQSCEKDSEQALQKKRCVGVSSIIKSYTRILYFL